MLSDILWIWITLHVTDTRWHQTLNCAVTHVYLVNKKLFEYYHLSQLSAGCLNIIKSNKNNFISLSACLAYEIFIIISVKKKSTCLCLMLLWCFYNNKHENSTKSLFSQSDMLCAHQSCFLTLGWLLYLWRAGFRRKGVWSKWCSVTNTHRVQLEHLFTD